MTKPVQTQDNLQSDRSVIELPSATRFVPQNTNEKILFTALTLIAESGSTGFSLNAIARRGKFSKGSIFFHFKNLEEICLGCYDLIRKFMRPTLQSQGCKDIQDFLEKFGAESFARTSNQHYFSMIYFFAGLAMNNPKFRVLQRELTQEYLGLMGSAFKALAQVPVSDERIIELVSFMAIVLDGIASHRIMFDDPQRMTKVWQLVVATIAKELGAGPAPESDTGDTTGAAPLSGLPRSRGRVRRS
jgi:AcrR family transcriptional regulator